MAEQSPPQIQGKDELPVVDGLYGVLLGGDVDGQLPDVEEGAVVGQVVVQLHQGLPHKIDERKGGGRCELSVLDVGHVHLLDNHFQQRSMFAV